MVLLRRHLEKMNFDYYDGLWVSYITFDFSYLNCKALWFTVFHADNYGRIVSTAVEVATVGVIPE